MSYENIEAIRRLEIAKKISTEESFRNEGYEKLLNSLMNGGTK